MFSLRFPEVDLQSWAARNEADFSGLTQMGFDAKSRGYLEPKEFRAICKAKSPRSQKRCASNPDQFVRGVTRVSLSTTDEQLRIQVLTLLRGVAWPTASYLLHFCFPDRYPILDFRALWSLSTDEPKLYDFKFWSDYVEHCRSIAIRNRITIETLDRALWQYSLENQSADAETCGTAGLSQAVRVHRDSD